MSIFPEVSAQQISLAMEKFDDELRSAHERAEWSSKESFKYAIFYNFNIYPVKQIVSMATGVYMNASRLIK